MFDAHDNGIDDLPISLTLRQVLPSHFGPVHLRPVDDLEPMSIIDLNSLCNVGTLNDGSIIPMSRLHQVDTLVEVVILLHESALYIYFDTKKITNKS